MDPAVTADAIHTQWRPGVTGWLGRVEVMLAEPGDGERFPRDRHIRFSTRGTITFAAGFDRLRESTAWDLDGIT